MYTAVAFNDFRVIRRVTVTRVSREIFIGVFKLLHNIKYSVRDGMNE